MRYNETVYRYVLLRLRVEYIGNEDMPCVGGSMSTFLGVCDNGTELMTKITDRASWAGVAAALQGVPKLDRLCCRTRSESMLIHLL